MPEPQPSRILAVLLGASTFPHANLAEGRAFYNSAADFKDYLFAPGGLALPRRNILSLFDDSRSPSDQLVEVATFLASRSAELKSAGQPVEDLFIHYVGHGLFTRGDQAYCLAVRSTHEINEGATSIRAGDLAGVIKEHAAFLRRFLILDCCFAAGIHKDFQSGPLTAVRVQIANEFPERGTALLCSSNARDVSLAPQGLDHTMFSNALIQVLRQGHAAGGPRLSFSEVGDLVKENLRQAFPDTWVRPEVHSPDQREGNIAQIPLFPNPAHRRTQPISEAPPTPEKPRPPDPPKPAPTPPRSPQQVRPRPTPVPRPQEVPPVAPTLRQPPVKPIAVSDISAATEQNTGTSDAPWRKIRLSFALGFVGLIVSLLFWLMHKPAQPSINAPANVSELSTSPTSPTSPTAQSTEPPASIANAPATSRTPSTVPNASPAKAFVPHPAPSPCAGAREVYVGEHTTSRSITTLLSSLGYNTSLGIGTFRTGDGALNVQHGPNSCFSADGATIRFNPTDGTISSIKTPTGADLISFYLEPPPSAKRGPDGRARPGEQPIQPATSSPSTTASTAPQPCAGAPEVSLGDHRTIDSIARLLKSAGYNSGSHVGTFQTQGDTIHVWHGSDSCFAVEDAIITIKDGTVSSIVSGAGVQLKGFMLEPIAATAK